MSSDINFTEGGVIDLTSIEVPSFDPLPSGTYEASLEEAILGNSKAGNPMVTWRFRTVSDEPGHNNRVLFYHTPLNNDVGIVRLKETVAALDQGDIDMSSFSPANDLGLLVGRPCRVRVGQQPYEGETRNTVKGVSAPRPDADTGFLS